MSFPEPPYEPTFNPPAHPSPAGAQTGPPQYLLNNVEESVSTTSTVKTPHKASRFAVGGLVAAMAVGGALAARSAMTEPAGPASSDEAVTQMFQALDDDDFVGVAELIHPAERESLAQPIFEMIDNYSRLGIIASSVDTSSSSLTDIEVDGLTYSVEATGPRLHWITTTGGTMTSNANFDPPAGPLMDRLGIETPDVQPETVTEDMGTDPVSFAVVEVDGSWYVSLWYTAAETVRREAGEPFLGLGNGPTPVGSDSPDAVMEDLVRRVSDFDGEGIITLMDPNEAAALYDYSPHFLGEMKDGLAEAKAQLRDEDISWSVDSVDFVSNEQNGRQIVSFNSIAMTVDVQGEQATVAIADGCLQAQFQGETIDSCDNDGEYGELSTDLNEEMKELLDFSEASLAAFSKLDAVDAGMTVVERDGRWYLSMMPTLLGTVNDHLAVLESDDLFAIVTDLEKLGEDPDRLLSELDDLTGGMAFDAFDEINPLGTSLEFQEIPDTLATTPETAPDETATPGETGFEAGPEIENILPDYFSMDAPADSLYLGFDADLSNAPAPVSGRFVFGDDGGSIEVAEFEAPVNAAILAQEGWSIRELGGVIYATSSNRSYSYAFVNNFVVWAGNDDESVDMLMAQIDLLK